MSKDFDLAECTAECKKWFSHGTEEAKARNHRTWHESRDSFAARELDFPFRRWYESATINEVEQWHIEGQKDATILRRYQKILTVMFGQGRLCCWLYAIGTRTVQGRRDKRDSERIAAIQKLH